MMRRRKEGEKEKTNEKALIMFFLSGLIPRSAYKWVGPGFEPIHRSFTKWNGGD
jgi:hypothetical protein